MESSFFSTKTNVIPKHPKRILFVILCLLFSPFIFGILIESVYATEYEVSDVDTPPETLRQFPLTSPCKLDRKLVVRVLIDTNGIAEKIEMVEYEITDEIEITEFHKRRCAVTPEEYEKTVLTTFKRWKFKPGLKDGEPVRTWLTIPLTYTKGY